VIVHSILSSELTFENLNSQIEFSKTSSNVVMNSILSRSRLLRISICHRADSPAHELQEPRENHRVASVVHYVAVCVSCSELLPVIGQTYLLTNCKSLEIFVVLQCVAVCCSVL